MRASIFVILAFVLVASCTPAPDKKATSGKVDDGSVELKKGGEGREVFYDSSSGYYYEYSETVTTRTSTSTATSGTRSGNAERAITEHRTEEGEIIEPVVKTATVDWKRLPVRLPHHINTDVSEYYPCPLPDGRLLFTGMDRTGHFEYKIDYTVTREAGGEDGFVSGFSDGLPEDARPIQSNLNTNAHEAVTQVLANGDFLMTANYQENLNNQNSDQGIATPDIFIARTKTGRVTHLPEPVNSLYGEYDGFMFKGEKAMLFASDRPGGVGEYKKKGWRWNENLWGNTDIYVVFKEEGEWSQPINLGKQVNTPHAERTPWLSADGKTLYISSNGYSQGRNDLDVFMFTRSDVTIWDKWSGPVRVLDVCSSGDDWCYRPDPVSGNTYFARSLKLKFKSSLPSREGDGYIRETGWRPGYTVLGAQSAALRKEWQTDIFMIGDTSKPSFTLPDVLFDVDKYSIKPLAAKALDRLSDLVDLNSKYRIEIQGHTDNTGTENHNRTLSINRAKAVKDYLVEHGADEGNIVITGLGSSHPAAPNSTPANKQKNRRVEIYFKRL